MLFCRTTTNLFVVEKPSLMECDVIVHDDEEKLADDTFTNLLLDHDVTLVASTSKQDQAVPEAAAYISDNLQSVLLLRRKLFPHRP